MLQERSISDQLKTLIVRPLTDVLDVRANDVPGGISNLSKSYGRRTQRYDPALLMKYPPDHSEGFVCDERKARRFGEYLGWAGFGDEWWRCCCQAAVDTK